MTAKTSTIYMLITKDKIKDRTEFIKKGLIKSNCVQKKWGSGFGIKFVK